MDNLDRSGKARNTLHPPPGHPDRWMEWSLSIAAGLSAAAIVCILLLLGFFCMPLLVSGEILRIFSWTWQPFHGHFGILPMCAVSLLLSVSATSLAFPVAVGICCYANFLVPAGVGRLVLALMHFMAGIPTVIYAFVSIFLLVPMVRDHLQCGTGFSFFTAMLTLSLLILPTMVLVFNAHLQQADPILRLAAEAAGMNPVQQVRHLLIPTASRGLVIAAVLGFGRAVGDTMVSLMLAGNAPQLPGSPFDSVRTLTAHIALVISTDSQSMAYQSVFASGLVLFFLLSTINLLIRRIGRRQGGAAS